MTFESDFRFAIFDRGRDWGLTQWRKGAEPQRDFCRTSFGRLIGPIRQTVSDVFGIYAFAASRLCVEIHGIIQLCAVKVTVNSAKFAGLGSGKRWHPIWHYLNLGASYVQIKSDKFTSVHVWSAIGEKYFFNRAPRPPGKAPSG
jgi:hypothetical protein